MYVMYNIYFNKCVYIYIYIYIYIYLKKLSCYGYGYRPHVYDENNDWRLGEHECRRNGFRKMFIEYCVLILIYQGSSISGSQSPPFSLLFFIVTKSTGEIEDLLLLSEVERTASVC